MADESESELAARLFGESSDEEYAQPEVQSDEELDETKEKNSNVDDDDENKFPMAPENGLWDFDEMILRKKRERQRNIRKRNMNFDLINDNDNKANALVLAMNKAATEDRCSNEKKLPAVSKLKLLPDVKLSLLKSELFETLVEHGMMNCISDWLSPLPDKSLPSLEVRTELLKILKGFPNLSQDILRSSGLGRAIMFLYKHPKEIKSNKEIAAKLIQEWARPIFQLDADFCSVSREERVYRDKIRMPEAKKKKLSSLDKYLNPKDEEEGAVIINSADTDSKEIKRARVPRPSTKDYVLRPKHKAVGIFKGERKGRDFERIDAAQRQFIKRTKTVKYQRSVPVSVSGNKLSI